jgi:chemotaxis protein methyltransferase CheR
MMALGERPSAAVAAAEFSADDMAFFADELRLRTGIVLAAGKAALVVRRLAPRMRELGCADFAAYRRLLADRTAEEWERVVELLTTNHSHFFREVHHFKLLARHLRARMAAGQTRLRIWSAACAAGQEPYSMAMLLLHLGNGQVPGDARILATDVDRSVLAAAQAGHFAPEDVRHLPGFAKPYLRQTPDGRFAVAEILQDLVRFKPHNLIGTDWPMKGPFDAIFCRNMLIYLAPADQAKVVARLAGLLSVGGILCLGHSEVARDNSLPLERIEVPSSYVRV